MKIILTGPNSEGSEKGEDAKTVWSNLTPYRVDEWSKMCLIKLLKFLDIFRARRATLCLKPMETLLCVFVEADICTRV